MRLVLILIASATLGVGCAFPRGRSEPATFFTLTPLETLDGAAGEPTKEVLGLGPVAIPGYLDRPQLVTRVGANEVQLAAVARWGEPIREGIVRVLRQNLMAASAARAVIVYPWTSAAPVDLAVAVDVLRFEPNGRGDANGSGPAFHDEGPKYRSASASASVGFTSPTIERSALFGM